MLQQIFQRVRIDNGTPTGRRVHDIMDAYMSTLRYDRTLKPLNMIIITDGEAQDESLLHWSIEEHVSHLSQRGFIPHQVGLEFLQVCTSAGQTSIPTPST